MAAVNAPSARSSSSASTATGPMLGASASYNELRAALVAMSGANTVLDTDWTDLSSYLISPFTGGTLIARRQLHMIEITGSMSGSVANLTSVNVASGIPAQWLPSQQNRHGAAYYGGSYPGDAFIRPAGTIAVCHSSGAARTSVQFTIVFFV